MSNIIQLKNPRTELYNQFKSEIKSEQFNWNYYPRSDETATPGMLSHTLIQRPEPDIKYSQVISQGAKFAYDVLEEILNYNDIEHYCYYRINLNMVLPQEGIQQTPLHVDHWDYDKQKEQFPHWNMLVYFSNEGKTLLENEEHDPKEDDVIIFPGLSHCHEIPKNGARTVLVATYI